MWQGAARMDGSDYQQTSSNEIWRLALDVRAAWDRYFSILAAISERGPASCSTEALALAQTDVERAERRLFRLTDQAVTSAND